SATCLVISTAFYLYNLGVGRNIASPLPNPPRQGEGASFARVSPKPIGPAPPPLRGRLGGGIRRKPKSLLRNPAKNPAIQKLPHLAARLKPPYAPDFPRQLNPELFPHPLSHRLAQRLDVMRTRRIEIDEEIG